MKPPQDGSKQEAKKRKMISRNLEIEIEPLEASKPKRARKISNAEESHHMSSNLAINNQWGSIFSSIGSSFRPISVEDENISAPKSDPKMRGKRRHGVVYEIDSRSSLVSMNAVDEAIWLDSDDDAFGGLLQSLQSNISPNEARSDTIDLLPATIASSGVRQRRPQTKIQLSDLKTEPMPFLLFENEVDWNPVDSFSWQRGTIRPGDQVEISNKAFIDVRNVVTDREGTHYLIGEYYESFSNLGSMVDHSDVQVCLIQDKVNGKYTGLPEDHCYIVAASQIKKRTKIMRTNFDSNEALMSTSGSNVLFCRMKRVGWYKPLQAWFSEKGEEKALINLTASECANSQFRLSSDDKIRENFRGPTILGGSGEGYSMKEKTRSKKEAQIRASAMRKLRTNFPRGVWSTESLHRPDFQDEISHSRYRNELYLFSDNTETQNIQDQFRRSNVHDTLLRRYTFADTFCGGGGVSRGAVEAGLYVKWAFDKGIDKCNTYLLNFPWVATYLEDVFEFLERTLPDHIVDILHISPVCCPFSPAHTTPGRNDEDNQAASFTISNLLMIAKPRVFTLEQTYGIEQNKHAAFRDAVIRQIVSCGYSVRWRVVNLADFGVPQRRKRFMMIGSCPGEQLPPFPKITHRDPKLLVPGTKPWNFVSDAIQGVVPSGFPFHDLVWAARPKQSAYRKKFDGTTTQANVITTKGGLGNCHPSGTRGYTLRESALLQTFPIWHDFTSEHTNAKVEEQIGNAVPPIVAKVFYDHLRCWLLEQDGILTLESTRR